MGCNWGKLLSQDRCKAIGVPWNDQDLDAIYKLKIPAKFVRNGCLTVEDYEKALAEIEECKAAGKGNPLEYMELNDLIKKAEELKINFTPAAIGRNDLIQLIKQSELPIKEEVKVAKKKVVKKKKKTK
jgi:hypothetical protein